MSSMTDHEKAMTAIELLKIETDRHQFRSRVVWRFHLATWVGFLAATKLTVDLSTADRAALRDWLSGPWGWRGLPILLASGVVVGANLWFLFGYHRPVDEKQGKNAAKYHKQARKLAGIAGSLPKSKGYGKRAQVAEATMTLFTAFVFIAVTLAVTAG